MNDNSPQADTVRIIHSPNQNPQLFENQIITSRYKWWNFIPINVYEQFHRFANIFFLSVAILQSIPQISQLDPTTGYISLCFMLSITLMKNGYEDYRRHKVDHQINSQIAKTINRDGTISCKEWQNLNVGDLVYIENDCTFPADLVILYSHSKDGRSRIETAALDGETNLKFKNSVGKDLHKRNFEIHASLPNPNLTDFRGKIIADNDVYSLDISNFVPRNCVLRKTEFAVGVIVYTGKETKTSLNATKPHFKYSELDSFLDKMVIRISIVLIFLCIGMTVGNYFWTQNHLNAGYLQIERMSNINYFFQVFSWVIVLSNVIPLSVFSSLDIVRFFLAQTINADKAMIDETSNSQCRNSDLVATIGRVTHIFSDKTGTLTKNLMTFKSIAFHSALFGTERPKFRRNSTKNLGLYIKQPTHSERLVSASDECLRWMSEHKDDKDVKDFLLTVVLCNAASTLSNTSFYDIQDIRKEFPDFKFTLDIPPPEIVAKFPYLISYQSPSPDEIALLHFARECGYIYYNCTQKSVYVIIDGNLEKFKRPIVFDFNSKRKRMSIVYKDENDCYTMLVKGADATVLPRSEIDANFEKSLDEITDAGLRTLVFARKTLQEEDMEIFSRFNRAKESIDERDRLMEELSDEKEVELEVFAFSGVDDELQDEVALTLQRLRQANIKVWMLTGDKLDTALSIAQTSGLAHKTHKIVPINKSDIDDDFKTIQILNPEKTLLAVEGTTLRYLLGVEHEKIKNFFELAEKCNSVVCARCEPSQKGDVVRNFMLINPKKCALAIGDGSNDVDMLRAANVGIGVEGKEGSEAVMSSDFSIPSFRHIARLLIVHGRWCVNRCSLLVLLTFYKNTMNALLQIYYGFFNGFSATSCLDGGFLSMFNTILTIPQLFFICIFEEDVAAKYVLAVPQVYRDLQTDGGLSNGVVLMWYIFAFFHTVLIFFYSYFESNSVLLGSNSSTFDLTTFTQITGWTILFVFTFELLVRFKTITIVHIVLYTLCIIVYCLIEFIYSYIDPSLIGVLNVIFNIPRIWFSIPFVVGTIVIIDMIIIYLRPIFLPSISDSVAELQYASQMVS